MREIKFRVWDRENKEMLDVKELDYQESYNGQPMVRTTMYNDYFDTEDMILMQYTGLKDKNEKEIYEGDIVKINFSEEIMPVKFDKARFVVEDTYKNRFELYTFIENLKVIGNIYNDPELLEEKR